MNEYYSPISCMYHYLHMAEKNFRQYLKEEAVWTKKYFYVLRPVLACIWIERGHGVVPIEFGTLVDHVVDDADLRREIDDLLVKKRAGAELDRGPRNPVLSGFLETELDRLKAEAQPPAKTRDPATLDIDADGVNTYAADLLAQGLAARTVQARLTAAKSFTRWLVKHGKLAADPLAAVAKPSPAKDRRHERRMLLHEE